MRRLWRVEVEVAQERVSVHAGAGHAEPHVLHYTHTLTRKPFELQMIAGGWSAEKPVEPEVQALFDAEPVCDCLGGGGALCVTPPKTHPHPLTPPPPLQPPPQVRAAVAALLGAPVASLRLLGVKTQVVAGVNYRVSAALDGGDDKVVITAFKPLPHTGLPLEVKSVVRGGEL